MKCYTQVYVINSIEAVETYCRAFGAKVTYEVKNDAKTAYEHCELSVGSDLSVYHVGSKIKRNLPILEAYDMTTEAVLAKLMWILGGTAGRDEVARLFYTPVACDILSVFENK